MAKTYTTVQGDMWDSIAFRQMGSETYTNQLMALNPQYRTLYTFPAGVVLTLPEPQLKTAVSLPPWKRRGA